MTSEYKIDDQLRIDQRVAKAARDLMRATSRDNYQRAVQDVLHQHPHLAAEYSQFTSKQG